MEDMGYKSNLQCSKRLDFLLYRKLTARIGNRDMRINEAVKTPPTILCRNK